MPDYLIDDNAAIYFKETGAGKPALVFLHYWGGSSRTWSRVIDRLGGKPRCIAIDQRRLGRVNCGRRTIRSFCDGR
jgi:pimeloyl-ACP methyl ester carboxylesterase